ncbi:MFS transporter [Streptomyces cellulosae]|uniref:MFS transporter n=1 Tax=Streptomyces cellulosae TaxID=1968 RepID=A0ABW7YGP9_STRCE
MHRTVSDRPRRHRHERGPAQPPVGSASGPEGLLWIADAYTLALACCLLAAGLWSDTHGRRRAFTLGLALCGTASVAGGLATGTGQVVAARLAMGCGAALLMPSTLSLITVVFPDPVARRKATTVWTFVAGLGVLAGPVIGGLLVEHYGWRAGFWINVPGIGAVTCGMRALVWSIIQGPVRGWTDPAIGAGFTLAALAFAFLLRWEKRHPAPLLPPRLFADRRFTAAVSALAWMFFALFGSLFLLTLYLQTQLHYTPAQTGLRLLPLAAALGAGAGASLLIAPRWGDQLPVTTGMLLVASGFGFLALAPPSSGYAPALGYQLVAGFGAGLAAAPATEAVLGAVPGERAGTGAALNDLAREVGGALGIAVLGSLLAAHHTQAGTPQPPLPHSTPAGPSAALPDASSVTFMNGLHAASWAVAAAALSAALIAAVWLPRHAGSTHPAGPARAPRPESETR